MLAGIALVVLWLLVFVLAAGEAALRSASRARLEEVLERPATRNRYLAYLAHAGPVAAVCVLGRAIAFGALITILATRTGQGNGLRVTSAAVGIACAALAELGGRLVGRKWSTAFLIVLLPPLWLMSLVLQPLFLLYVQ